MCCSTSATARRSCSLRMQTVSQYSASARLTRTQRGYGTAWQRLRKQALRTYPPICWLCGRDIDLKARGRWAWTLDHLDPITTHGTTIPTLDRVRPAHLRCNVIRANSAKGRRTRGRTTSRQW